MSCAVPENIHTSPSHLWKLELSFIHFFNVFGLADPPPPPPEKSNLFCGGSMDIFWTCTYVKD